MHAFRVYVHKYIRMYVFLCVNVHMSAFTSTHFTTLSSLLYIHIYSCTYTHTERARGGTGQLLLRHTLRLGIPNSVRMAAAAPVIGCTCSRLVGHICTVRRSYMHSQKVIYAQSILPLVNQSRAARRLSTVYIVPVYT